MLTADLSYGQRQLVCFARALLRKTRLLVLDEATSSIDLETDEAVQKILRSSDFKGVTTITVGPIEVRFCRADGQIAHRINTIIDSDRVLVMELGKVAEYDTPEKLLADPVSENAYRGDAIDGFSTPLSIRLCRSRVWASSDMIMR